jgi:two-component system OmpR family response regulator
MLPKQLALIDDDREYTEYLSQHLRQRGMHVDVYPDSNDLITSPQAFAYDFYIVDLMLPGLDGLTLIGLLRRRTNAGVLVVSGKLAAETFESVISGGADMYLSKPVQFEQIDVAIQAVQRRVAPPNQPGQTWMLDLRARKLWTPDQACADLSDVDVAVLACFVRAEGSTVTRDALLAAIAQTQEVPAPIDLNATIYRLRRRVDRAVPVPLPLLSRSKVGYLFNAPLKAH